MTNAAAFLLRSLGHRCAAGAGAGVLVLGLLAGCSDGNGGDDGDAQDPTSSVTTEATDETSQTAEPEPYLEVPEAVELTPAGTTLRIGDKGTVAWEPRQGRVAVIEANVRQVARTTFEHSFKGWQIDDETAALTPYFVDVRVRNVGEGDLGELAVPMYASDDRRTLVEASTFQGRFKPCPGGVLPKRFRPDAKADLCFVYLLAPGRELEAVTFTPPAGIEPISWSGPVENIAPRKKGGRNNGSRGGQG